MDSKTNKKMDIRDLTPATFGIKFGVILADPPWLYTNNRSGKVADGAVQYDELSVDELKKLRVSSLAKDNSLLFMWATSPKLLEAIELMAAWGYKYVTALYWFKLDGSGGLRWGTGHWSAGCVEPVLIGKRGNVSPPGNTHQGAFSARIGKHSQKPDYVHNYIEDMLSEGKGPYPLAGPCLELFARKSRGAGWYAVGNELDITLEGKVNSASDTYKQAKML